MTPVNVEISNDDLVQALGQRDIQILILQIRVRQLEQQLQQLVAKAATNGHLPDNEKVR